MVETLTPPGPAPVEVAVAEAQAAALDLELDSDTAPGLVAGRPIEDRSFEAVEAGAAIMTGMVVGSAVAGPVGTAVGGLIGAVAGLAAGEVLERHEGRAAETTDASEG